MEDEHEALLLRLVRAEHLGQQPRPEVGDGRAHRHARPDAAEREVLDREAGRRELDAELGRPLARRAVGAPGAARPDRSPFTSVTNTETPAAESCSAIACSVRVLPVPVAPAISPCRFVILSATFTCAAGTSAPSCTPVPSSTAAPSVA